MARALECPACGALHRLDDIPSDTSTFRCDRCGQVLKMPAPVSTGGPPPPPRRSGPAPVAPPPRRRTGVPPDDGSDDAATRAAPVSTAAAVSATVSANGPAEDASAAERRERPAEQVAPASKRKRVHWYWRLLAWIVAVPLGFVITAWPAYELGFIKKDDVLDIFVGTGSGRYVRLGVATVVWAVITALLVQLLVEGGRAWSARRRARAAVAA